jgi:hypothetical protein
LEYSRKSSTGSAFQRLFISSWLYFNRFSNISLYHNLRNISQHWHIRSKIPHMLIVWVYQDWVWIKPSQWVLSAVLPPPPPLFSFIFPEAFSLIIRKKIYCYTLINSHSNTALVCLMEWNKLEIKK